MASPSESPRLPRRFPLIARVVTWLLLNVALLAVISLLALQHYFRNGFEALLTGSAWDRVSAVAALLTQDLQAQPRADWGKTLARYGSAYNLKFYVFSDTGTQFAGERITLPAPVSERLAKDARRPPRGPGPGRNGPPDDPGRPGGLRRPEEPGPRGRPPVEVRPGDRRPPRLDPRPPQLAGFIRTSEPALWWVLTRVDLSPPVPDGPVTNIMASESFSAGGLLVDLGPALRIAGVALAISILVWIPLVRGITRHIALLRNATSSIAVGRFDVRVDDRRSDELGELGTAINSMAGRIEGLLTGQKRFLSDVAHELCAPLSRLQVALGILEEKSRSSQIGNPPDLEVRLGDLREEVDHIAGLVNELLSFSRAALGTKQAKITSIALADVLRDAAHREEADDSAVTVSCDASLHAKADPDLLGRAVGNLVRNAVRYAGPGPIEVTAASRDGYVGVSVADRGPGVPAESLPKLFDPFYRVDTSRTRDTGGVGLGLTIARTCVEACGGTIHARNRDGGGLEMEIRLTT
jgi:two-component system sensor histidine kinase CpxA